MRWILLLVSLPTALVSWLAACLLMLVGLARAPRVEPLLVLSVEWRSATMRWSVTLGRAVVYAQGTRDEDAEVDTRVERHEHVHVRQVEDYCAMALLVGTAVAVFASPLVGLLVWVSGGLWVFVHNLTAAMRWGFANGYRDAEHERSAYAQTDKLHNGRSWLEIRDEQQRA